MSGPGHSAGEKEEGTQSLCPSSLSPYIPPISPTVRSLSFDYNEDILTTSDQCVGDVQNAFACH